MNPGTLMTLLLAALGTALPANGQSSSIGKQQQAKAEAKAEVAREAVPEKGNPTIEKASLIAVKQPEPKKLKVNDLVTIIVRERTEYEADGTANARRQADLRSELDAFLKFTGGGVGAAEFRRGKPNINYRGTFNQRNDAESEREDRLTTRLTARIIDIKPNGNLVFEARKQIKHDEETHTMTLTGTCRGEDVTLDNSVLSTQVADLFIHIETDGSIRDATRSGWIGRFYDLIRPL